MRRQCPPNELIDPPTAQRHWGIDFALPSHPLVGLVVVRVGEQADPSDVAEIADWVETPWVWRSRGYSVARRHRFGFVEYLRRVWDLELQAEELDRWFSWWSAGLAVCSPAFESKPEQVEGRLYCRSELVDREP